MYTRLHKLAYSSFTKIKRKQILFPSKSHIPHSRLSPIQKNVIESANFESYVNSYTSNPYESALDNFRQLDFEMSNSKLKKTERVHIEDKIDKIKESIDIPILSDKIKLPLIYKPSMSISTANDRLAGRGIYAIDEDGVKEVAAIKINKLLTDIGTHGQLSLLDYTERSLSNQLRSNLKLLNSLGYRVEYHIEPLTSDSVDLKGFGSYLLIDCSPNRKKNGVKYNYTEKVIDYNDIDVISIKRRHLRRDVEAYLLDRVHMIAEFNGLVRITSKNKIVLEKEIKNEKQEFIGEIIWHSFDYRKFKHYSDGPTFFDRFGRRSELSDMVIADVGQLMNGNSFYRYVDINN